MLGSLIRRFGLLIVGCCVWFELLDVLQTESSMTKALGKFRRGRSNGTSDCGTLSITVGALNDLQSLWWRPLAAAVTSSPFQ